MHKVSIDGAPKKPENQVSIRKTKNIGLLVWQTRSFTRKISVYYPGRHTAQKAVENGARNSQYFYYKRKIILVSLLYVAATPGASGKGPLLKIIS